VPLFRPENKLSFFLTTHMKAHIYTPHQYAYTHIHSTYRHTHRHTLTHTQAYPHTHTGIPSHTHRHTLTHTQQGKLLVHYRQLGLPASFYSYFIFFDLKYVKNRALLYHRKLLKISHFKESIWTTV
jgi:hypothetical protein